MPAETDSHPRKTIARALWTTAVAAATFRLIRFEIAEHSMRPTLRPGDWAFGIRTRRLRANDVVVLEHPDRPGFMLVKRIAAIGSDGQTTVTGDDPAHSVDSRSFGPIAHDTIKGRLVLVYHPRPLRPV